MDRTYLILDRSDTPQGNPVDFLRTILDQMTSRHRLESITTSAQTFFHRRPLGGSTVLSQLKMLGKFVRGHVGIFIVTQKVRWFGFLRVMSFNKV